ncbi:MAG: NAD-dependent epimerase/dehydratase family protein [Bryobacterales bacterium]|nr:NAD-dependent epimerase/dehydratase family protein [Bryobacterales bacterium]
MIFILGGHGLVGSAFARVCETEGREYAILDRTTYRDYVGQRCDVFVNANGNSRKPLAKQYPMADFDASVRTVRASLVDFRFGRYVHLSSCDVYADCSSPEVTREEQTPDVAAQSPYGFHKYLAEECVRHAAGDWLIFRLGGFVGPGLKKNAIFDILHGGPLWLDAGSELQFLHTEDAARIMLGLADGEGSREVFNLCGRGTIALSEVLAHTGREVAVTPGSPRVRYEVSIEKIRRRVEVPETRAAVLSFVDTLKGSVSRGS